MKYHVLFLLLTLFTLASCKKINPDKPTFKGTPISLPKAISTINVPLEIPLSYLENQLNNGLKELLYAEKGLNVGNGLFTDINVFRTGQINLSTYGKNSLKIKFPMRLEGNLKIEKKLFGQMISTSIPYDEALFPEVSFSPEIGENWDVTITNLKIESWGRSLKYNLLGYEVDFDPMIRKQVEKILSHQLTRNGGSTISFKNLIEETWEGYGRPLKIGKGDLEAYIYTIPHKIKINEQVTSDQKLKLNIGLEGEVITHVGEFPQIKPTPLPGLSVNEDTVNHMTITLPLAVTYSTLDRYLQEELVGKAFTLDNHSQLIPEGFTTQSFGDRALVKMKFTMKRPSKKVLKGELFLVGKPTFDRENEAIVFEDIEFDFNTKNLLASSASWLKQGQVLDAIKKHATYPIGPYIQEARMELQNFGYITTDFASFRVENPELNVQDIFVTEDDIRIYLDATGQIEVSLKDAFSTLN